MLKTIYVFWPLVLGEFHCCGKTNRCFLLSCCHFSQSCRDRTEHNLYHVPDLLRALAPQASAACRDSGQSRAQRSLPVLWCKAPSCCRVALFPMVTDGLVPPGPGPRTLHGFHCQQVCILCDRSLKKSKN